MRDFLGREYGPGDLVIYGAHSGRSINMVIGRVEDIYEAYYSTDTYKWERIAPGESAPAGTRDRDTTTKVKIQPLRGSRWEQHSDRRYYVDARSGKRIDPKRTDKHVAVFAHYAHADGTPFDYESKQAAYEAATLQRAWNSHFAHRYTFEYHFRENYHVNYGPLGQVTGLSAGDRAKTQLWYVPDQYYDYVEERKEGPKPVTIDVTENIVKWDGDLPPEALELLGVPSEGV